MKLVDRLLQRWRIVVAIPWISRGARVLDIGCYQGELFESLRGKIGPSVGIDPLARAGEYPGYRLLAMEFSQSLPFKNASFDVVTMLAVLEHIAESQPLADECRRLLAPEGRVIISVPQPAVERILETLLATRLADGMSVEQHRGYDPSETEDMFCSRGFNLEHHSRFQLGLNNLFVFRKRKE